VSSGVTAADENEEMSNDNSAVTDLDFSNILISKR
jgi:hypothetical protein